MAKDAHKTLESLFPTKKIWEVSFPASGVIWFKMGDKVAVKNTIDRYIGEYALVSGSYNWSKGNTYSWRVVKNDKIILDSRSDIKSQTNASAINDMIGLSFLFIDIDKKNKSARFHLNDDSDFIVDAVKASSEKEVDFSFHFEQHGVISIRYNWSGFYFYDRDS